MLRAHFSAELQPLCLPCPTRHNNSEPVRIETSGGVCGGLLVRVGAICRCGHPSKHKTLQGFFCKQVTMNNEPDELNSYLDSIWSSSLTANSPKRSNANMQLEQLSRSSLERGELGSFRGSIGGNDSNKELPADQRAMIVFHKVALERSCAIATRPLIVN